MNLRTESKIKIAVFIYAVLAGAMGYYLFSFTSTYESQEEKNHFLLIIITFNAFVIGYCLARMYKFYRLWLEFKREGWRANW